MTRGAKIAPGPGLGGPELGEVRTQSKAAAKSSDVLDKETQLVELQAQLDADLGAARGWNPVGANRTTYMRKWTHASALATHTPSFKARFPSYP